MKYLVLFLMSMFPLLSISAQNLEKMDSVQRNKYLIDLSSEVIKTMGPGYYRNTHPTISEGVFKSNDGRAKIKKNIGRKYYEIKYPYDKSKETLEFDFSAKVRIWKDTGEPCDVIFGNGYGKNFLIGKGLALHATTEVLNRYKAEQKRAAENEAKEIAVAKELAEKLNATKLTIKHKVGANGQLIGSVTNKEVSETLEDQFSIMIDKKNISLDKKIKSVGIYELDCKLGHSIHATLKVDIIGE